MLAFGFTAAQPSPGPKVCGEAWCCGFTDQVQILPWDAPFPEGSAQPVGPTVGIVMVGKIRAETCLPMPQSVTPVFRYQPKCHLFREAFPDCAQQALLLAHVPHVLFFPNICQFMVLNWGTASPPLPAIELGEDGSSAKSCWLSKCVCKAEGPETG